MTVRRPTEEEIGDWRIAAATFLTEALPATDKGAPAHPAGSVVRQATYVKIDDGPNIGFTLPSASAMALNVASKSRDDAELALSEFSWRETISPDGNGIAVDDNENSDLFDFFEMCLETTVFSYLAIEMFCNHSIGRLATDTITVKRRKKNLVLTPTDAERQLSTNEKLSSVLPKLYSVPTPKGKKVWEPFRLLERTRDAVVHLKSQDQYPNSQDDLYYQFLNSRFVDFPSVAASIIAYFYEDKPRWLRMGIESQEKRR